MRYLTLLLLLISCAPADKNCPYAISPDTIGVIPMVFLDASNVPTEYNICIINAIKVWNKVLKEPVITFSLSSSSYNIVWQKEKYLDFFTNARTEMKISDGIIFSSTIRVNDYYRDFSTDLPTWNELDCESVMIHEIGHLLGIGHIDDPKSVMYPTIEHSQVKRELNEKEIESLQCLYRRYL